MSTQRSHRVGGLVYKRAHWKDWASVVVRQLFALMYRLGIDQTTMIDWLRSLSSKLATTLSPQNIPDEVLSIVSSAAANSGIPVGEFLRFVTQRLLEDPPPGYRKKKDELGRIYIVKQTRGPKSTERPLHKGNKFFEKVFVGAWWSTDAPRSSAHVKLRNIFKRAGGGIFYKKPAGIGFTEYFAYAIVPASSAIDLGMDLYHLSLDLLNEDGDRACIISAARLDSLAAGEPVKASDTFTVPRIFKSQKFNFELNLPDLLNGRSTDSSLNQAVKQLLKQYRG